MKYRKPPPARSLRVARVTVGEISNGLDACVWNVEACGMVGEISKDERSPLLPVRYPTPDFFVCDLFDAAPKGDMASMNIDLLALDKAGSAHPAL